MVNNSNTDDVVLEENNPWADLVKEALSVKDEESTAGNGHGNGNGGEDDDDGSWSEDGAVEEEEEEEEAREPKGGDDSEAETEADSSEVELEGRQVVIPGFALREDRREAAQGSGSGSGRRGPGRRRRRHPDGGGGGRGGDLVLGGSRAVAVTSGQVVGWDVSPGAREVFSQYAACSVQMNRDGNQQLTAFNARSQELLAKQFQRALTVRTSGSHVQ